MRHSSGGLKRHVNYKKRRHTIRVVNSILCTDKDTAEQPVVEAIAIAAMGYGPQVMVILSQMIINAITIHE